jgi:hypothetical protein
MAVGCDRGWRHRCARSVAVEQWDGSVTSERLLLCGGLPGGRLVWRGLATRIGLQARKIAVFRTKGEMLVAKHTVHWPPPWARSPHPECAHLAADRMLRTRGLRTPAPWRFRNDLVIAEPRAVEARLTARGVSLASRRCGTAGRNASPHRRDGAERRLRSTRMRCPRRIRARGFAVLSAHGSSTEVGRTFDAVPDLLGGADGEVLAALPERQRIAFADTRIETLHCPKPVGGPGFHPSLRLAVS